MFGTDLEKAYFDNTQNNQEPTETSYTHIPKQVQTPHQQQVVQKEEIKFDPTFIQPVFQNSDNDHKIKELQQQLKKQTEMNLKMNQEVYSVYDRFISKKKDVIKLVSFSLTILLAISLHFVMSDLIKNYLLNNDFSSLIKLCIFEG